MGGVIVDITDDSFLEPQTWEFPEVGEELEEIIRKLEELKSKSNTSKKKAKTDISMDNCPPSPVSSALASSCSAIASVSSDY